MSRFVSRRTLAAASSLLLAAVGLTGCIRLPGGGGSNSTDIASMKNIPEGIKRDLINQMNSASGAEKNKIIEKANALNNMVGAQLVGESTGVYGGKFKLDPNGTIAVNKDDKVYAMMSAADYWRLGEDSYDLCVDKDCQYYSSWTIEIEGSGSNLTYVWTLKIDNPEITDEPLVRQFKVK